MGLARKLGELSKPRDYLEIIIPQHQQKKKKSSLQGVVRI